MSKTKNSNGYCKYIMLKEIPTKIMIFDDNGNVHHNNWTSSFKEDSLLPEDTKFEYDRLVIMFSGFLGEIEYYREFLEEIYFKTDRTPLIGLSNSGSNRIPKHMPKPDIKKNSSLFSLEGQIDQKVSFIRRYIHSRTRIILIGHSIACYIILQMMDRCPDINQMIEHCILLFPVIDRLIETKEAQFFHRITTTYFRPLYLLFQCLDRSLRPSHKERLVLKYMSIKEKRRHLPPWVRRSATNIFDPYCLRALRSMALDQLRVIRTPPIDVLRTNAPKLSIMYGDEDRWVPVEYYRWIQQQLADCHEIDLRLCLTGIDHSLVVDSKETLAAAKLTYMVINSKWNLQ